MNVKDTPAQMHLPVHSGHFLVEALKRHKDRPLLYLGDVTLTGSEMEAKISQYVQAFEALGAGTGSTVALLALNQPEVLMLMCAGQNQGWRRVSLHPIGSLDDHAYVIEDAGVTTIVVDPLFVGRAAELVERCPGLTMVLTLGPVPEDLAHVGTDLIAKAEEFAPRALTTPQLAPEHVVSITYTGGTTGKPKGVIATLGNITTMYNTMLAEWEWPDAPRFLVCTPLSHGGGAFFTPAIMKGGTLYVVNKFDVGEMLRLIEEHKITATMLVPTMIYAILDHPDSHTRDLSSLETIYYGASAMNPVRLKEAIARFGPIFAQFYGQSEAPMALTYLSKADHLNGGDERLTSCGRPSMFSRLALLDDDGKSVPVGAPGEICASGPLLSAGYWNLPEETAAAFRDGWLHTGDVAREDADGFWHIVDRVKDMIVTGGFNVFPREVEDVIAEHPWVAQVGVIGTPHEKYGEAVTAIVVLRAEAPRDDDAIERLIAEVQAVVKERKGAIQSPKQVIVAEAMPTTLLGKPDKKALRAQYWTGSRAVG